MRANRYASRFRLATGIHRWHFQRIRPNFHARLRTGPFVMSQNFIRPDPCVDPRRSFRRRVSGFHWIGRRTGFGRRCLIRPRSLVDLIHRLFFVDNHQRLPDFTGGNFNLPFLIFYLG